VYNISRWTIAANDGADVVDVGTPVHGSGGAAGVPLGIRISVMHFRIVLTTKTTPAIRSTAIARPPTTARRHAAPVAGHAPRAVAPLPRAPLRCMHRPDITKNTSQRVIALPAAVRVHPRGAVRQPGRLQQEDPPRSRSGIGQGQDGWTRSKGPTCPRKGARGLRRRTDATVHHQPGARAGEAQSVSGTRQAAE
jgi:hypothetical protein